MKPFLRRAFNILVVVSAVLCVGTALLWVRTEAMQRTESFTWGGPGVYHCLDLSGDDAKYKVLYDPGSPATPAHWEELHGGWTRPPRPSKPSALPPTSVTWVLPRPDGTFQPTSRAGSHSLGIERATFAGWYGPGTSLVSYRVSYFVVMLPSTVLPALWLTRFVIRRWRHGRHGAGRCRNCGYDLRATPEEGGALLGRCPECGAEPK